MSRAVITGIGCLGPVCGGAVGIAEALRQGKPLGKLECVEVPRGREREMRLARLAPFDRSAFLNDEALRRMEELAQVWVIACLLARTDAGLAVPGSPASPAPPEERGIFLGTAFGCIGTTWEYLRALLSGASAANPFLFSESVANAPAGHSAVELDARGPNTTLTCGDASAAVALAAGARAIAHGRAKLVYCGGVELLPPPLVSVLAALQGPRFIGEGCVCLVVESLEAARARGATIYAEVIRSTAASDPRCAGTEWSSDTARIAKILQRTADLAGRPSVRTIFLHASGSEAPDAAEAQAAELVFPGTPTVRAARVLGGMAASGGFNLALAAREASRLSPHEAIVVSACSWGGGLHALAFGGPPR